MSYPRTIDRVVRGDVHVANSDPHLPRWVDGRQGSDGNIRTFRPGAEGFGCSSPPDDRAPQDRALQIEHRPALARAACPARYRRRSVPKIPLTTLFTIDLPWRELRKSVIGFVSFFVERRGAGVVRVFGCVRAHSFCMRS